METKTPLTMWEKGAGPVFIFASLMSATAMAAADIVAQWRPYWEKLTLAFALITLTFVSAVVIIGIAHIKKRGLPDGY